MNLHISPNVTTIMTGHRNIRSYLHRLKIIGSPECPCKLGIHTVDHLIFQCNRLKYERGILKNSVPEERWAGHVARMGEGRGVHMVLVGKPEGKRPLGRPRRRWEDNIKMDL